MSNITERLAHLSPQKRELVLKQLQQKGMLPLVQSNLQQPPMKVAPRQGALPLSFAQQRLWFLDQLHPRLAIYNIPTAVRLHGPLDVVAFTRTVNEIVRRHEILRTTFPARHGTPQQQINPYQPFYLPQMNLAHLPEANRESEAKRLAVVAAQRPFDLAHGPLLRILLLQLNVADHVLLLNLHHIISDGWSTGILIRELSTLYRAYTVDKPSPLPELPLQYADFATWQRQWLQGEVLEQQLAYWQQQLAGAPTQLNLATDRPRPPVQTSQGARHSISLPPSLSAAILAFSRREEVTLFTFLLAAFQVLLYRYTGESDLVVGSPIAGRNRIETEGLIGLFVNTLALRVHLTGGLSFKQALNQVRDVVMDASAHQDIPFEKIVEELKPDRNLSHSPLFQVMFVLQNTPEVAVERSELALRPFATETTTAKFDLTLSLAESNGRLAGAMSYNSDLFDAATIAAMCDHFETLLENIIANPNQSLAALPLLAAAAQKQFIEEWNTLPTESRQSLALIHELFEAQVARTPDGAAVTYKNQQLTYHALNQQANRLARQLRQAGITPDSVVAIYLNPAPEMVIAVLAILKAGGAYLPLDPNYPQEHLAFMLEDTRATVLITAQSRLKPLPLSATIKIIHLDSTRPSDDNSTNLTQCASPDNLAYVIYTSGSTGRPKGVMIPHRSVVNYLRWCIDAYDVQNGCGSLVHSSLAFDLTVTSLFAPLLVGKTVTLLPSDPGGEALYTALPASRNLSLIKLTPSHLDLLNHHLSPTTIANRTRHLIIGGEALHPQTLHFWQTHAPQTRLINEYGPTETVVGCSYYEALPENEPGTTVPIGRPITNTQLYVLDNLGQLAPIGAPGELFIGGTGVGRGYWHRPGLTAEKFVPDPFSQQPGARLYRTGDLARYRLNKNLEFLGRLDHQVKVRGYRIELPEIEIRLAQHPLVQKAIVMTGDKVGHEPHAQRLIAYLVSKSTLSQSELRQYLAEKLPAYMLPTDFVFLDAFPLTSNGKIDRQNLPAPHQERPQLSVQFMAPRSPLEETLTDIWSDVLGRQKIGVADDFFELGGHSLLATQVISRIQDMLQITLPVRQLFETPTIGGMASIIEQAVKGNQDTDTLPIRPVSRQHVLPLSFAQQRLWFLDQLQPGSATYNIPVSVRLVGRLNVAALTQAIGEIIRRHEVLRTNFPSANGRPNQQIMPAEPFTLPVINLGALPDTTKEAEAKRLVAQAAYHTFDLASGPLLHATLLQLDRHKYVAIWVMHHIISDGWSSAIFLRELSLLYKAYAQGESSPLPELTLQYADYAVWQQERLEKEVLDTQLAYWQQQLADTPSVLSLPTDQPRSLLPPFSPGASQSFYVANELFAALKELCHQERSTLFMTLLAAFQALLFRYTGEEDIVVGTPIAGRNRIEIEPLIGLFVNTLVIRTNLTGQPGFRTLLRSVRETVLEAYSHQDLPFEKLVEALQPERSLSHAPLFQVMFAWQNIPQPTAVALPDLHLSPFAIENKTAKFDLSLSLAQEGDYLGGVLEYNRDLFTEATIQRLIDHFLILLQAIVTHPDQAITEIPLLTPAERQLFLAPGPVVTTDPAATLLDLLAQQAAQTPYATALATDDMCLTYQALHHQANRLAHRLHAAGLRPEQPVALYLSRSPWLIIGLLGILKAGGVALPLDTHSPPQRLHHILSQTKTALFLTENDLTDRLPPINGTVLCLDDPAVLAQQPTHTPPSLVLADNLAYIIFTSGSTGTPKGVGISHHALLSHIVTMQRRYQLSPADRVLQFAPLHFDVALEQLLPALITGASLLLRGEDIWSLAAFNQFLAKKKPTIIDLPTAYWQQWSQELLEGHLTPPPDQLRLLIVGGEAMPPVAAHTWQQTPLAHVPLLNAYGPTEATITATIHRLPVDMTSLIAATAVSIGAPLPNRQAYLLDSYGQPVPLGVTGQLHLAGNLARGYLAQPARTAVAFVPHPISQQPGARLYNTGDLARHLPDGNIEFLGRADHQVKMRGFRIELGEIEAILNQHSAVHECLVLARKDNAEHDQLVAYLRPSQPTPPSSQQLRAFLQQHLPDYMLPTFFFWLDAWPLLSNGKVDRQALPAPTPTLATSGTAARTPIEALLLDAWSEMLPVNAVGIHDNFFELGGHSLLATQLISRLRALLGVELPLRLLFDAPSVAQFAPLVSAALKLEQPLPVPPLLPLPDDALPPLSFAQQRLWFLDQLQPHSSVYNIPLAVRLNGQLDLPSLQGALSEISRRHQVLRTVFPAMDGRPVQKVLPTQPFALPVVDLGRLPQALKEGEVQRLAALAMSRSFSLASGPLWSVWLLPLASDDFVVLLTMHHIISDGWSMNIFIQELAALYRAYHDKQPSPLPDLSIQYADFAAWQRDWLQGEVLDDQLGYWRQQLGGSPSLLALPTDFPRPAVQSNRGASLPVSLPPALTRDLVQLSRAEGVTLFMTLLAAFKLLLFRYSHQSDVLVGSPIAGRNFAEIEPLIGFFVNTLVLRTDLSGQPSFRRLLQRVRHTALAAYTHQDLPFEKLVEALQPERSLSHAPLFQVMFAWQTVAQPAAVSLPDLRLAPVATENRTAKFDLSLSLAQEGDYLGGVLEYNRDLFTEGTIQRMLDHFYLLLAGVLAQPDRPITQIPLLTPTERQQLLVAWNDTNASFPEQATIHELIEAQAQRTPDAIALSYKDQLLTYQQLDQRANQLARYLRRLGVRPGMLVGLSFERSPEMVVGLLGILKAGGAYLPLDPTYPQSRLAFMIEDAQIAILLALEHLVDTLPSHEAQLICLDSDWPLIAQENNKNLTRATTAENLAYIIYTSGSTGQPKGVMVPHRGLINVAQAQANQFSLSPTDRVLQFSSLNFDASISEILMALTAGATLCLGDREELLPGPNLAQFLQVKNISITTLTPSTLATLPSHRLPYLHTITVAGEACPAALVLQWATGRRFFNLYGPTEASIWATVAECRPVDQIPSIGQPIPNTQTYVLDAHLQPAPVGFSGQLHLGGVGVSWGYWQQPALTAEKFIPHPFSQQPGARLYKTGDLVRYLPDANLEFLGRIDHQVKLRGFRIELGEIETVLNHHPLVHETVIVAHGDDYVPGDKYLVAYLVTDAQINNIRDFLRNRLPDYMIPAHFITLDTLPLSPNGKIDRRALPTFDVSQRQHSSAYVGPRNELELKLTKLWADLLDIQQISVQDSFFNLGGHSILAARLMARIEKTFNQTLPLTTLFQENTIERLALVLQQNRDVPFAPLVPIQPDGHQPPFFCVHAAGGHIFRYINLARHLGPEQPVYGLQAVELDDKQSPQIKVEQMAATYIEAIRAVQPEGPYLLGGWSMGGTIAYEMAQQLQKQQQQVGLLALFDTVAIVPPLPDTNINKFLLGNFAYDLGLLPTQFTVSQKQFQHLSADSILHAVWEQGGIANIFPPDIHFSQVRRMFNTYKANVQAAQQYIPAAYSGRLVLFKASAQLDNDVQESGRHWHSLAKDGLEVYSVPGDHITMLDEQHVSVLAAHLRTFLHGEKASDQL